MEQVEDSTESLRHSSLVNTDLRDRDMTDGERESVN